MKIKKLRKTVIMVLTILIILCIYFIYTALPMYEGRLTIDINNTTFTTISGATLEYELIDKVVKLPQIKPLERLIVIAPTGVSDKPLKTRVFINYNGESKEILGEYYTLSGNKYNTDIMQCTKIKIKHKGIVVQRNNMFNVKSYINLKPYLRMEWYTLSRVDKHPKI